VINPVLIAEVLSSSTESYDRGVKSSHYRRMPSLKELVLVSQHSPNVETLVRRPDGTWLLRETCSLHDAVLLESLEITVSMREIYHLVQFQSSASDHPER
jgi:Uma2 family endonuclease